MKLLTVKTLVLACLFSPINLLANSYIPKGYSIETIKTPDKVEFQIAGLDANAQGEIYVATRLGEVWRYHNNQWSQFAEGLHEPAGLLLEGNSVLIAQKPELTRLVDSNGDQQADEYIHLASGWEFHDNYHEFNFGPVKDKQGNYYGTLNLGHGTPGGFSLGAMDTAGGYRGWAYQVTPSGEFIPFASGLRSPAGIGISPQNDVFFTDNQGDWVETSKLHLLKKDAFYGHPTSLRDKLGWSLEKIKQTATTEFEKMRELPVVWIPHREVANSPGNPEWDTSAGKFGPFSGQIFIGDQTQSNIFRVVLDKVNGQYQGAVINFINGFQSGNIRTKFDNQGQLWVAQTTRGWSAQGDKPYGLQKVTWDGTTPFELLDIKLTKAGFKLNFTQPVSNPHALEQQIKVQQWHYLYSSNYGSAKQDLTQLAIKSINWNHTHTSADVALDLTAGKIVQIDFPNLMNKSGEKMSVSSVYYTLNQLLE
ncbi:membrane protein [Catenovulum maritimum]|uniref:Membrane protein n=1 Tax=Catenovulum maritimum TaxID=1513271 RepID=A0A0J8GTB8_9ALTE|nr:membrane protein [Catenovulum maritimum]KMT64534.1 membrane protein [Catenovulum maritimum]